MPFVQIGEQKMYYAARGASGAPLVFIHGAGGSHRVWNGQLGALSDIAQCYALDLPGHGRSTGADRATILEYARAARAFLDALQIEHTNIVGISMGGAIAQTMALEFPERVAGLGLVATGAKLRVAPAFLDGLKSDFKATAQILVENYFTPAAPAALKETGLQQLLAAGAKVAYDDFAACDAFDVRTRLAKIHVPTLVLCGRQDQMTPPKYSEFLAQNIPHAQLVIVEHAGHMVMLEQPAACNDALRHWLTVP